MGDMVCSTKGIFKNIISIELDPKLAEIAQKKFKNASNLTLPVTRNKHVLSHVWIDQNANKTKNT